MATATQNKVPVVLIRRRGALLGRLPVRDLPRKIKGKVLFPSDRMSVDGKNWVRLDRDSKIRKYFREESLPQPLRPVHKDQSLLGGGQVMQAPDIDLRLLFVGTIIITAISVYFYYFH
jgi:hypothetical protein